MHNWQPRIYAEGGDLTACPHCGGLRHPSELLDVSGVPDEISNGCEWACGPCVSRWVGPGLSRADLARYLGAPEDHAAALEAADTPDPAAVERNLIAEIDAQAEAERIKFITSGAGQAMTYEQKRLELAAFDAGGEGPFPFFEAEAAARGISVADVAAEVRAATEQWRVVGAEIEAKRLAAKAAVRAAETVEDKRAAAQVDWSLIDG